VLHHLMKAHSLLWLLHQYLRHNVDTLLCDEAYSFVNLFFMRVRSELIHVEACILQLLPMAAEALFYIVTASLSWCCHADRRAH